MASGRDSKPVIISGGGLAIEAEETAYRGFHGLRGFMKD